MRFTKFDVVDYLGSEKDMAADLSAVLDENDPDRYLPRLEILHEPREWQDWRKIPV